LIPLKLLDSFFPWLGHWVVSLIWIQ
jgi:hypothetical protein